MAQFTKKAIMQGFIELLNERPLDKISVVDIAERCGINRNTFYYYYCDIYALIDELFQMEAQKISNQTLTCESWQDVSIQAIDFVRNNRRAVYHLFHSANRQLLEDYLYRVTFSGMSDFVRSTARDLPVKEADIQTLSVFYTSALLGLVTHWLYDGMKDNVEDFIADIGRLIEGNLRQSLEKSCMSECEVPQSSNMPISFGHNGQCD